MSAPATSTPLLTTPLNALHIELGARMVPFAGYSMPVQYPAGLMAEHVHTRTAAGLFDVSHMGQLKLIGADAAAAGLQPFRRALNQFENFHFLLMKAIKIFKSNEKQCKEYKTILKY